MSVVLEQKQGLIAGDGLLPVKMAQYAQENGFDYVCDGNNISDFISDRPGILITYEKEFIRNEGDSTIDIITAVIAVVDDDEMVLTATRNALTEFGVKVETFTGGESFMNYVNEVEKVPDLILLDVKMPGMDGFEVMNKIKEIGGDIGRVPVIFLTADTDDGTEQEGLNMGALDFIKKPIINEVLRVRVNHILELSILRKRYRGKKI
jgi:CheY-like chemotaxis protein